MPEIRYIRVYKQGTYPPELLEEEPYEVSDEELAEEQEVEQVKQIEAILDKDWTAAQSQEILKKLIKRLLKKGVLP